MQALAFYLFSAVTIGSALMVVTARNPVHSVFFLISAFFSSAGIFVLLGAEFLAMILIVVYVGAVAVLFLFVVMMLDVPMPAVKSLFIFSVKNLISWLVIGLLFAELLVVVNIWGTYPISQNLSTAPTPPAAVMSNTVALGNLLYTDYIYAFQLCGIILLLAMVGAIVLSLRKREGVKRQNAGQQINRTKAEAVELVKMQPGQGLSL